MTFLVTKNGENLSKDRYTLDKRTKIFSSTENNLVICAIGFPGYTFNIGSNCILNTSYNCIFNAGNYCIFNTEHNCNFKTGWGCVFDTGEDCIFKTENNCIFKTGSGSIFYTNKNCVVIRRDVFEVIQIPENTKIQLNSPYSCGYIKIKDTKTITIDGKDIEVSNESFEALKKQRIK